ncbi:MAG: SPOR domain-containing protein [Nitrosomonadales bacterium]|nr:SPOR domain-containing protein [Nitrosomonadales bacterium]
MIKKIFWILLLVNVIFFAVMQRGGLGWGEQRLQAQPDLHAELIHLLPALQNAPAKATPASAPQIAASAPVSAPSASSPDQLRLASTSAVPMAEKPENLVCMEWGDFSGPDLARASEALAALGLADKLSQRQIEQSIGYWVYIPPLKNKAAISRKIAELKTLGIREYFVVQNSERWRNAISLGAFKSQDAAQNFLHSMHAKGVRTAKLGERASKAKATIFMLDRVNMDAQTGLTALQKAFSGSELKNVACPH